jgi:hypothetical protein
MLKNFPLICTGVAIYGLHYFQAKFLKTSQRNINLKKTANSQQIGFVLFFLQAFLKTIFCVIFQVK